MSIPLIALGVGIGGIALTAFYAGWCMGVHCTAIAIDRAVKGDPRETKLREAIEANLAHTRRKEA